MNTSIQPAEIHDRGRGPEIKSSRITVLNIWEFYKEGDSAEEIAKVFPVVTLEQVRVAIEYIENHREEVTAAWAEFEARVNAPRPEWLEKKLAASHEKLLALQAKLKRKKQ